MFLGHYIEESYWGARLYEVHRESENVYRLVYLFPFENRKAAEKYVNELLKTKIIEDNELYGKFLIYSICDVI